MIDTEVEIPRSETVSKTELRQAALGADHARVYIEHILENRKVHGNKRDFGPGILKELHKRILFYKPHWAGQFRVDDDTSFSGRKGARADELEDKVYLFENWLEHEINNLRSDPEDLLSALRVASAAHYGVVSDLHPFNDGNGRVARVLLNGILVLNTKESLAYGLHILPVPVIRSQIDVEGITKLISEGKEPKLDPYLQALEDVHSTWTLNPFERYIASRWIKFIDEDILANLGSYLTGGGRRRWNDVDQQLIDKIIERRGRLNAFVEAEMSGQNPRDRVPDFFSSQHLRFRYAA